jgi:hypothetical protein
MFPAAEQVVYFQGLLSPGLLSVCRSLLYFIAISNIFIYFIIAFLQSTQDT